MVFWQMISPKQNAQNDKRTMYIIEHIDVYPPLTAKVFEEYKVAYMEVLECHTTMEGGIRYSLVELEKRQRVSAVEMFMASSICGKSKTGIVKITGFAKNGSAASALYDNPGFKLLLEHKNEGRAEFTSWVKNPRNIGLLKTYAKRQATLRVKSEVDDTGGAATTASVAVVQIATTASVAIAQATASVRAVVPAATESMPDLEEDDDVEESSDDEEDDIQRETPDTASVQTQTDDECKDPDESNLDVDDRDPVMLRGRIRRLNGLRMEEHAALNILKDAHKKLLIDYDRLHALGGVMVLNKDDSEEVRKLKADIGRLKEVEKKLQTQIQHGVRPKEAVPMAAVRMNDNVAQKQLEDKLLEMNRNEAMWKAKVDEANERAHAATEKEKTWYYQFRDINQASEAEKYTNKIQGEKLVQANAQIESLTKELDRALGFAVGDESLRELLSRHEIEKKAVEFSAKNVKRACEEELEKMKQQYALDCIELDNRRFVSVAEAESIQTKLNLAVLELAEVEKGKSTVDAMLAEEREKKYTAMFEETDTEDMIKRLVLQLQKQNRTMEMEMKMLKDEKNKAENLYKIALIQEGAATKAKGASEARAHTIQENLNMAKSKANQLSCTIESLTKQLNTASTSDKYVLYLRGENQRLTKERKDNAAEMASVKELNETIAILRADKHNLEQRYGSALRKINEAENNVEGMKSLCKKSKVPNSEVKAVTTHLFTDGDMGSALVDDDYAAEALAEIEKQQAGPAKKKKKTRAE